MIRTKNIILSLVVIISMVFASVACVLAFAGRNAEAAPSYTNAYYVYSNLKTNLNGAGSIEMYSQNNMQETVTTFPTLVKTIRNDTSEIDELRAIPNDGYMFVKWTYSTSFATSSNGVGKTENQTSYEQELAIPAYSDITVYFALQKYNITAVSASTSMGTVTGGAEIEPGKSITVNATPNTGYRFVSWTNSGGTVVSTSASYTFTPTENTTLTANFAIIQYTVTVSSANTSQGTVSGGGTTNYGKSITVTATPNTGHKFLNWTNSNGDILSTSASYTFTPTENTTLTANFTPVMIKNGDNYITNFKLYYDESQMIMKVLISPNDGEYITAISFDNSIFYEIDCWESKIYGACSKALSVTYYVTAGSNKFGLYFDFTETDFINIYVQTSNTAYKDLRKPSSGSVSGVAVSATQGGVVSLVGADYDSMSASDVIICSATITQYGYSFAGWYLSDDMDNPISTDESVKLTKSSIYGQELVAKFVPISENADSIASNVNSQLNNI